MSYLVAKDYATDTPLGSVKHPRRVPKYGAIAALVRSIYPDAIIYDHLTPAPRGARLVTVYVSPTADGVGRDAVGGKPVVWAVVLR